MRTRIFLFGGVLLATLSACKTTESDQSMLRADDIPALDNRNVLLWYSGGFNSCTSSKPDKLAAMDKFNEIKAAAEAAGKTVHTVFTCYDGMRSAFIRWQASGDPNTYAANWDKPFDSGQLEVALRVKSNDFRYPTYIIGHSYGGWLTSNLVAHVSQNIPSGRGAIQGLYSIDPISPYHCNQAGYAATLTKGVSNRIAFWRNNTIGGCEVSPPQFTTSDSVSYPNSINNNQGSKIKNLVRGATRQWISYYQTLDYLHSSAVNDVGGFPQNTFVSYSRPFLAGTSSAPHVKIHTEPFVWNSIKNNIMSRINAGASLRDDSEAPSEIKGTPATQKEMDTPIETPDEKELDGIFRNFFPQFLNVGAVSGSGAATAQGVNLPPEFDPIDEKEQTIIDAVFSSPFSSDGTRGMEL